MCSPLTRVQALLFLSAFILPLTVCGEARFNIAASPTLSTDGKVVISWESAANTQVVIQQDSNPAFIAPSTLYRGSDSASVVTGLVDGDYHYRGRLDNPDGTFSGWSPTVDVRVQHHSLPRAFSFFFVGLVVFVATLSLIILGARRHGVDD